MSESLNIELHNRQQARAALTGQVFPFLANVLQGGARWILSIKMETRTQAQNRLMWPLLAVFAEKLEWPVNGYMTKMDPDDWKDILSAAFKGENVRLAMGLNGGIVLLGQRTSKFSKAEFSDWIEFLYATAADRGVTLPAWQGDEK